MAPGVSRVASATRRLSRGDHGRRYPSRHADKIVRSVASHDSSRPLSPPAAAHRRSLLNRQVINEARREQLRRPRSRCNRSRSYVMFHAFLLRSIISRARARARMRACIRACQAARLSRCAPPRLSYFPEASPGPRARRPALNDNSISLGGVSATAP